MGRVGQWLLHLSDPEGPLTQQPGRPLRREDWAALLHRADAHGVLAAVVANAADRELIPSEAMADASRSVDAATGLGLMLRQRAKALAQAARSEGVRMAVIKGPVFAEALYPQRRFRRFTDIDILVAPAHVQACAELLSQLGYTLSSVSDDASAIESNWLDPRQPAVVLDVQTDLVHADSVKHALTFQHVHVAGEDGEADQARPAALLVMACIHGAMHQYTRLIHLVDICQAARAFRTDERADLELLLERCGARFVVAAGLQLAGKAFGEPRCLDLAAMLGATPGVRSVGSLVDENVLTSSMSPGGWIHSWRRKLFREMIKRRTR